jgi:hypothetical protein
LRENSNLQGGLLREGSPFSGNDDIELASYHTNLERTKTTGHYNMSFQGGIQQDTEVKLKNIRDTNGMSKSIAGSPERRVHQSGRPINRP